MKGKRQEKIRELIAEYDIETQEELTRRLMEEGFSSTQERYPEISGNLN